MPFPSLARVPGGWQPAKITVSPRNAEKAASLAERFPERVSVAADNQSVVDSADVVLVGLLPDVAAEVLPQLAFRPEQRVVSMMATVPHADVVRMTKLPADQVTISVPLPTTQRRQGPVLMYPPHSDAKALYAAIGTPVPVEEEGQIKVMISFTSLISQYYAILDTCTKWATRAGADEGAAGNFVGSFFAALAAAGKEYVPMPPTPAYAVAA